MFISILYPPTISLPFSVAALLFVLLALAWIRKYYGSIRYHFTAGKIMRYSGVLVKNEICIHCHQIHRISTRRGTFQRLLGFSTVDLLTTDPRAPSGSSILLSSMAWKTRRTWRKELIPAEQAASCKVGEYR